MQNTSLSAHEAIAATLHLSNQGGFLPVAIEPDAAVPAHTARPPSPSIAPTPIAPSSTPRGGAGDAPTLDVPPRACHTHLDLAALLRDIWWTESHNTDVHDLRFLPVRDQDTRTMAIAYEVRLEGTSKRRPHTYPCPGVTGLDGLEILLERALLALRLLHSVHPKNRYSREHPTGHSFRDRFRLEKEGQPPIWIRWSWERSWSTHENLSFGAAVGKIFWAPTAPMP